jgi:methionyl-tRNA synthetase
LPKHVFAHGWLTKDGQKISKTTGNTVDPAALVAEFGSDAVRNYFLRAFAFGQDGDYTRQGLVSRYNADLANDFGNLVQRATALASRSTVQAIGAGEAPGAAEDELRTDAAALADRVAAAYESVALHEAAGAIAEFVGQVNRYIERTRPWDLARKSAAGRLAVVLDHLVEAARLAAWYYAPIIPSAATEAHRRLTGTLPTPGQGSFVVRPRGEVELGPPLFPRLTPTE